MNGNICLGKFHLFYIDATIFSAKAVRSAIHDLDLSADISVDQHDKNKIRVLLQSDADEKSIVEDKVRQAVLDHQIRIDVEKEFAIFRKLDRYIGKPSHVEIFNL